MKKINYIDVKATSKEDLIGSYLKCPWCKNKLTVTEGGIFHGKDKHFINYSLEDIFEFYKMDREFRKRLLKIWFNLDKEYDILQRQF